MPYAGILKLVSLVIALWKYGEVVQWDRNIFFEYPLAKFCRISITFAYSRRATESANSFLNYLYSANISYCNYSCLVVIFLINMAIKATVLILFLFVYDYMVFFIGVSFISRLVYLNLMRRAHINHTLNALLYKIFDRFAWN